MTPAITATMLYNYVQCPHRFTLDLFGDPEKKDRVSPFVQLLWERGHAFEDEVMSGKEMSFTDLSGLQDSERESETLEAIARGDDLIYSGRIRADDLLGVPDLLRKAETGYVAGDIKSGSGEEGPDDNHKRPKKHYAVQLALYTDILERLDVSAGRTPFVWDVHGDEIVYDLNGPFRKRTGSTLWAYYQEILDAARKCRSGETATLPAYASNCKLCQWYTFCKATVKETADLTQIPELGRSKRDKLISKIPDLFAMASIEIERFTNGVTTCFPGIRRGTLLKFKERAQLQTLPGAVPYLTEPVTLPQSPVEIFFDIETDPMRDHCYLHGFLLRKNSEIPEENYMAFLADQPTPDEEARIFKESLEFISRYPDAPVYYYSAYERTYYRRLATLYPEVADVDLMEALFEEERFIDLYNDVVRPRTEWPTMDYSIKTLARYLGFRWRDANPSGAASVEWYHRWIETGDETIKQRILEYNMDDCVATRVLVDGIKSLKTKKR